MIMRNIIIDNDHDNKDNLAIEQVFSPRVYTSQGVPISVTGIAQVYHQTAGNRFLLGDFFAHVGEGGGGGYLNLKCCI